MKAENVKWLNEIVERTAENVKRLNKLIIKRQGIKIKWLEQIIKQIIKKK